MRVLRPQVEEINAKYPGQDKAMERQKATMELYSRAGASPMSGCLPMLLQMPILIALFMFFPSAIELRHQSFLWAHDLSTYDAIFSWNKYIPIITPYFGNHISLFCLLMTITNIFYTKYNMEMTNTGQQQMPGMKMMYMMPLMFLVFFNQYASGLTYYYFISTLMTIVQTLIFRYTINEDKLLAKLEANKRKPMKKSGFMKRLEEAQRAQQETLRKQQEAKKNDRIIVIVVLEKGPFICLLVDKGTFLYILAPLLEKQNPLFITSLFPQYRKNQFPHQSFEYKTMQTNKKF